MSDSDSPLSWSNFAQGLLIDGRPRPELQAEWAASAAHHLRASGIAPDAAGGFFSRVQGIWQRRENDTPQEIHDIREIMRTACYMEDVPEPLRDYALAGFGAATTAEELAALLAHFTRIAQLMRVIAVMTTSLAAPGE